MALLGAEIAGVLYHSIRVSTQYAPMYFKPMENGDARGRETGCRFEEADKVLRIIG